jgi:hypothetical protein
MEMPEPNDDDQQARLAHLISNGAANDLEEIARLLGETDPFVPPPPRPEPAAPTLYARVLTWFWRQH